MINFGVYWFKMGNLNTITIAYFLERNKRGVYKYFFKVGSEEYYVNSRDVGTQEETEHALERTIEAVKNNYFKGTVFKVIREQYRYFSSEK